MPALYGQTVGDPTYRIADPSEMFDLLIAKLREETEELADSRDPEELADVFEVVRALAGAIGSTEEAVEEVRREKAEYAGAFGGRIVWRILRSTDVGSVVIVTGPPGSGKSTVAGLVAKRFERSVHLESDLFFHAIVAGSVEPWLPEAHEQNTVVMRLAGEVAAAYARAGYLTIVDGILLPDWFLVPVTEALRTAGFDPVTVVLRPPLAVCLERAASRSSRALADPVVVERLWHGFAELGDLERCVIDEGERSAEEVAERVARSILDG